MVKASGLGNLKTSFRHLPCLHHFGNLRASACARVSPYLVYVVLLVHRPFDVFIIIIVVRDIKPGAATAVSVVSPLLLCSAASLASSSLSPYLITLLSRINRNIGFRVLGSDFSVLSKCACCSGAEGASEPTPACGTGCKCQGCGDPHRGCWGPAHAPAVSMHSPKERNHDSMKKDPKTTNACFVRRTSLVSWPFLRKVLHRRLQNFVAVQHCH